MNWTLIGLNWTVSLKCFETIFVVIWRYTNKTELKKKEFLKTVDCGILLYFLITFHAYVAKTKSLSDAIVS